MYNKHMINVDQFLLKLVNLSSPSIEETIQKRDAKVMRSLASTISSGNFITENQGKLLLKLLKENIESFKDYKDEIAEILNSPSWSKSFRVINHVKKFYVEQGQDSLHLTIEFTFSSPIRKALTALTKKVSGLVQVAPGKVYQAELTEKNIVELVPLLKSYNFDIDEKIENFYQTITTWSEEDIKNQFKIDTITYANFQKSITADLGIETAIDQNIINDRSVRYQYFSEKSEKNPENLAEKIANRKNTRCWIDKKTFSLDDIIASLKTLRRLPLLIVFDTMDSKKCLEDLENLQKSLEKNGIFDGVGLYFRLDNQGHGVEFNQFIQKNKFNAQLDSTTNVVGVANGKIPKFLLNSGWTPMSVISISRNLQHNKTSVYTNRCDLIINWSEQEPISESRAIWVSN